MNKRLSPRPGRLGVAVAAVVILLTACGGGAAEGNGEAASADGDAQVVDQTEWDQLVEDAKAEGTLVVYASMAGAERTIEEFETDYPEIDVQIVREPDPDLVSRLGLELQSGSASADVAFLAALAWYDEQIELETLAPLLIGPEAAEAGWNEVESTKAGYASIMRNPLLIGVNTDQGEQVANVEELIEAAAASDAPVGVLEPVTPAVTYQFQRWEEAYGEDLLDRLADLNVTRFRSGVPMAQSLAAGELAYVLPLGTGNLPPLAAQGAPVAEVVPDNGVGIEFRAASLNNAPHPNAAQLFVNWLMSERGQGLLVQNQGPAATPVPVDGSLPWEDAPSYDPAEITTEVQDEFSIRFSEAFGG